MLLDDRELQRSNGATRRLLAAILARRSLALDQICHLLRRWATAEQITLLLETNLHGWFVRTAGGWTVTTVCRAEYLDRRP